MISGGASRITSGAAALTRNPASRAAASTALAARRGEHDAAAAARGRARGRPAGGPAPRCRGCSVLPSTSARRDQVVVGERPQHGERGRRADRVAAEGAAVQAGGQQVARPAPIARQAPIGRPPPSPLASVTTSGRDAVVLVGEKRSGAADPGLHLVEHQQRAVPAVISRAATR